MLCAQFNCYPIEQLRGHQQVDYAIVQMKPEGIHRPSQWFVVRAQNASTGNANVINLAAQQETHTHAAAINKWKVAIQNPLADTSVNSLTSTAKSLLGTINEYGADKLTFAGLEINSVQVEHLATALRASSKWKEQIAGWDAALQLARIVCDTAGVDPADLLFGMV